MPCIVGVFGLVVLIAIVFAWVKVRRYPERYGPRAPNHAIGIPRQTRAAGLARAMLDTIPIIRFSERDAPANVELGPVKTNTAATSSDGQSQYTAESAEQAAQDNAISAAPQTVPIPNANAPGCAICTEDFETGQDIRILPCTHKYHPECVDPWLLNISGTCPICRVDLRPDEEDETPLEPLEPSTTPVPNRRSLITASVEDRLQFLRRHRQADGTTTRTEDDGQEGGSRDHPRLAALSRLVHRGRDRDSDVAPSHSQLEE